MFLGYLLRGEDMGLFTFLGGLLAVDKSNKKNGTLPTILGASMISTVLQEEQEDYWNYVNDIWIDVQDNDSISDANKSRIYDLCNELVETDSNSKRKMIINKINALIK